MKVYVGATFSRYLEARSVMDALTAAGHEITHDWTRTDAFGDDGHPLPDTDGGYDLPREAQAAHALEDIRAVLAADNLLILAQEPSCGWPVEVGIAIGAGVGEIWLVAPFKPTVFWCLPEVRIFADIAEPLREMGATP